MKLKLGHPVEFNGATISEVTLRRAKGKDLVAIDRSRKSGASDAEVGLVAIANLCDVPLAAVEEMDAADIGALGEKMAGFLPQMG